MACMRIDGNEADFDILCLVLDGIGERLIGCVELNDAVALRGIARLPVGIGLPDRLVDVVLKYVGMFTPVPCGIEHGLEYWEMLVHGTVGVSLHSAVEGGVHLKAVPVHVEAVLFRFFQELLTDPFNKMRRDAHAEIGIHAHDSEGIGANEVDGILRHNAVLDHLAEDNFAPVESSFGMFDGVIIRRTLQHPDEERVFTHRQMRR